MPNKFSTTPYLASNRGFALGRRPTQIAPLYSSTAQFSTLLRGFVQAITERQEALFASGTWSLLLIFQGMDAAGKDSAIKHVLSGINPQGCQVASFRQPSHEELSHDFLWRVHAKLPLRGQIGVFNRSYYEEVLIARIHRELLERQRLPRAVFNPEKIWAERQADIRWFESYLERQGTRVVKFFLHISPEEQRRRLIARLQNPRKRWKFDPGDARERSFWADYQSAYESCIANTHAKTAPWYVIPADNKRNARLLISKITLDALQGLDLELPRIGRERKSELARIERALSRKKRNEKCP